MFEYACKKRAEGNRSTHPNRLAVMPPLGDPRCTRDARDGITSTQCKYSRPGAVGRGCYSQRRLLAGRAGRPSIQFRPSRFAMRTVVASRASSRCTSSSGMRGIAPSSTLAAHLGLERCKCSIALRCDRNPPPRQTDTSAIAVTPRPSAKAMLRGLMRAKGPVRGRIRWHRSHITRSCCTGGSA